MCFLEGSRLVMEYLFSSMLTAMRSTSLMKLVFATYFSSFLMQVLRQIQVFKD